MIFPNGIIKEGTFEFNVYRGPKDGSAGGISANPS
jgi:hypothetical protein